MRTAPRAGRDRGLQQQPPDRCADLTHPHESPVPLEGVQEPAVGDVEQGRAGPAHEPQGTDRHLRTLGGARGDHRRQSADHRQRGTCSRTVSRPTEPCSPPLALPETSSDKASIRDAWARSPHRPRSSKVSRTTACRCSSSIQSIRWTCARPGSSNRRDRRKLLIVDGCPAFLGGIDISRVHSGSLDRKGGPLQLATGLVWRDSDLQLGGAENRFLAAWASQKREHARCRTAFACRQTSAANWCG